MQSLIRLEPCDHGVLCRPLLRHKITRFIKRYHPTVCQATVSARSMCEWAEWRDRIPKRRVRAKIYLIIGLVRDFDDKIVRRDTTKGHYHQALAPLHQHVLDASDAERGRCPALGYEDMDAIMLHSKLAADVI